MQYRLDSSMKKTILSFVLGVFFSFPVFSQTYDELCERAVQATEQDSLQQAERYIREALQLDPANVRNALLFSNLGTIQRRQRKYELALESYTYALNMAPRNVPILLNRAALYLELGKNEQACVDYSLVLDLQPDNREALSMRAYIYTQQRNYKGAHADYDSLLKFSPQDFHARLGLASLWQKENKYEASLAILNVMISEGTGDASLFTTTQQAVLYVARAGVEREMKHDDMALMDLQEAIQLDDSCSEAYLMRGQIYLSQRKKEQAKRDFDKAVALGIPMAEMRDLLQRCK